MALLRHRQLLVPTCLGGFILSIYLLTGSSDLLHNGDTDLRYQTTQAIVDHHRAWIAHPMWLDTRLARGTDGHLYAFYAPGQIVLMIPAYVAGKFIAHHLSLPYDITTLYASRSLDLFLGAGLAMLVFLLARSVGLRDRVASLLAIVFGLATVAWPDAQSALEQVQVSFFLLLGVLGLRFFQQDGEGRRRWLLLGGTGVGLAVFTRYDALLYAPLFAGFVFVLDWNTERRKKIASDLLILVSAASPWILALGVWDWMRFGSPFLTGLHEKTLGEPIWQGFSGLIFSPGKGFVWYLPILLVVPWGIGHFVKRERFFGTFCLLVAAVPLLFYSNVLYWHGDPAWGPRYLYTSVPYLMLPLGEILQRWRFGSNVLRLATVALVVVSFALQVSAVSVTQWRFWYRLEASEEHTSSPFRWGAAYYHYYWDVSKSPIWIQLDDVYQVLRLDVLGNQRYALKSRPTVCRLTNPRRCISNPADLYPVNSLSFWWADTRHPLLGPHTRAALAGGLGLAAGSFLVLLMIGLDVPRQLAGRKPQMVLESASALSGTPNVAQQ